MSMKLHEIIQEATIFDERTLLNTPWKSPKQLRTWLERNGFHELGEGAYAEVWGKPSHRRIVKISTDQDKCWIKFAKWAMNQTANPYVPNIPWVKYYEGTLEYSDRPRKFFVTIIERLHPFDDDMDAIVGRINDPVVLAALLKHGEGWMMSEEDALVSRLKQLRVGTSESTINRILRNNQNHKFVKTLKAIKRMSGRCFGDLHSGNVMARDDGTIVITDPLAPNFSYS